MATKNTKMFFTALVAFSAPMGATQGSTEANNLLVFFVAKFR